jgi:pimeloyl-ACP methyl ester carboxylesterase
MDVPVSTDRASTEVAAKELVVLIHGFAAPTWVLNPIARQLQSAGYETVIWSYTSYRRTLREHSDHLAAEFVRLSEREDIGKIHVVAHSMGTVVARGALRKVCNKKFKAGRVVLMAPPNRGTNWSRWFGPIVKWLIPTVYDLSNSPTSYVNQLPSPDYWYVGIVRADFDLLIPRNSLELSEQMDFIAFPTFHSGLLFRRDVAKSVQRFLSTGFFPHRDHSAEG